MTRVNRQAAWSSPFGGIPRIFAPLPALRWRNLAAVAGALCFSSETALATPPPAAEEHNRVLAGDLNVSSAVRARERLALIANNDNRDGTLGNPPALRSVLALNWNVAQEAHALDLERAAGRVRSPLHGIAILIKDNIETRELPTTAGSLALLNNNTGRDAPIVARLRAAGAIVLGKANLSEWANIRSTRSSSGWSAVGGLVRNPHVLDRTACGSSSGSAAAVAAGLAPAAIGTETDGSIVCPAAQNGIVGFKPTVGLLSRTHIVPISHSQDTPGPMTRTVADAALLLTVMAGSDPADPATAEADARRVDYHAALNADALRGRRLGVMRFAAGYNPDLDAQFDRALADLRAAGAELIEIPAFEGLGEIGRDELTVLLTELKADMNAYLATTPPSVRTRTLADLIAFNRAHAAEEMPFFGQELFERAEATTGLTDPAYLEALRNSRARARDGMTALIAQHRLDGFVAPTTSPAWQVDLVNGDNGTGSAARLPAVAGWPHLTVPMGAVRGLPVGLSFIGPAWSDAQVLAMGHAYEQRTNRRVTPRFLPTLEAQPDVSEHVRPAR